MCPHKLSDTSMYYRAPELKALAQQASTRCCARRLSLVVSCVKNATDRGEVCVGRASMDCCMCVEVWRQCAHAASHVKHVNLSSTLNVLFCSPANRISTSMQ